VAISNQHERRRTRASVIRSLETTGCNLSARSVRDERGRLAGWVEAQKPSPSRKSLGFVVFNPIYS
jgi:hypothetical protein